MEQRCSSAPPSPPCSGQPACVRGAGPPRPGDGLCGEAASAAGQPPCQAEGCTLLAPAGPQRHARFTHQGSALASHPLSLSHNARTALCQAPVVSSVGFSPPSVGDATFAAAFNERVNHRDISFSDDVLNRVRPMLYFHAALVWPAPCSCCACCSSAQPAATPVPPPQLPCEPSMPACPAKPSGLLGMVRNCAAACLVLANRLHAWLAATPRLRCT